MKTLYHLSPFLPLCVAISLLGGPDTGFGATSADKTRPTLIITYPAANRSVSNAVISVSGKTKDNVAVSAVYCRANGGEWNLASTTNGWTNWTADVTLKPYTNIVQAYAVDTSSNRSLTNTVKSVYAVYAPLVVQTSGLGMVAPDCNGKMLQVGQTYSITAKPGKGFAFSLWTGSQSATTAKLTFVMVPDLAFTANFSDVARPVSIILSPKANQKVSSEAFTVTGKAGDNLQVASVSYQLNGAGWTPAVTTNQWTNWTADVTLIQGPNLIQAYAVDDAGNMSLTQTVRFVFSVMTPALRAPASISGLSARVSIRGQSSFTIAFGAATYSQSMYPGTEPDNNQVGNYTYTRMGPDMALLQVSPVAPPSSGGDTVVGLTFKSSNQATFTVTNHSGVVESGTISLSQASSVSPLSIEGKTVRSSASHGWVTTVFGASTFTQAGAEGTASGSYTYTPYSPVGALLQMNFTSPPSQQGAVNYVVLTFSSASTGRWYSESYEPSAPQANSSFGNFTFR